MSDVKVSCCGFLSKRKPRPPAGVQQLEQDEAKSNASGGLVMSGPASAQTGSGLVTTSNYLASLPLEWGGPTRQSEPFDPKPLSAVQTRDTDLSLCERNEEAYTRSIGQGKCIFIFLINSRECSP